MAVQVAEQAVAGRRVGADPGTSQATCVLGVDVGGTHTDAALVFEDRVHAKAKVPTTTDVVSGIVDAVERVVGPNHVDRSHVGTTAFTNAIVEREGLSRAAAIRVGAPVSESLPPMSDWPRDLRDAVDNPVFWVAGGREYDGRPIRPLRHAQVRHVAAMLAAADIDEVAVTSVFGTTHHEDELQVADWLTRELAGIGVSLSHRIGRFGILERENATLLNAMLRPLGKRVVAAYTSSLPGRLFISQNDGTSMSAERAADLPVFTVASGPTNSLRGAAVLSGLNDAIVVDVGGTTTDAGRLRKAFPQPANLELDIAGVRTNFRMPDVASIGIGGGSVIDTATGKVGPASVGHRLEREARVFGGPTLTLTDIAVASGRVDLGDAGRVAGLEPTLLKRVDEQLRARLAELIARFDRSTYPLPVVLVGGGAPLVAHLFAGRQRRVLLPAHADIANAIGAATGRVSGDVDLTFARGDVSRATALEKAEREAHRRAVDAGARPDSIVTVELEDAALSYLAADGLRVRARAIGDLEGGN